MYKRTRAVVAPEKKVSQYKDRSIMLSTELLGRSERRSTSDVDVGGAELAEVTYCDEI